MELADGIKARRSIRAFKSTPVDNKIIEDILGMARNCPSNSNSQPWEVAVVTGQKKLELSKILRNLAELKTAPYPDYPGPGNWPEEIEYRVQQHFKNRYKVKGLENITKHQRSELRLRNFDFYGAPCIIFLLLDNSLGLWSIYDMGLFSQTICLAAYSLGLGSCVQASVVYYPDAVRDFLNIPSIKRLLAGIAIGYPDYSEPLNDYRSEKKDVSEFVDWYS